MPTEIDRLELRPGFAEDLPAVHAVFVAASRGGGQPAEWRTPEEVRAWSLRLLDLPGRDLWLARRGDELLGLVLMEGAWVELIFVHPDHQRRGVGDALLQLVKAMHPSGFGLRVHRANERARAFYRRHGLVELESTDGAGQIDHAADLQMAWPGEDPLAYLRSRIDAVDDELAVLLARRTALSGAVQDVKASCGEYAGQLGRDPAREAEIVERMARHVPQLDPDRIAAVMGTVIEQSLAAWEERR